MEAQGPLLCLDLGRDLTARKCRAASCTAQAVSSVFSCWGSGVRECQ